MLAKASSSTNVIWLTDRSLFAKESNNTSKLLAIRLVGVLGMFAYGAVGLAFWPWPVANHRR